MGALSFTTPLILTALASLPAIWWLLRATPPVPKERAFPPFMLLRELVNKSETPSRTPLLLLLLRLLFAAIFVVALAGPILNAPAPIQGKGPIVLILDDTLGAAYHWRKRKDALLMAAAQAEQADRSLYLVTTASPEDAPPQPLTPETLRRNARSLTPLPLFADRELALKQLSLINADEPLEIRWLSDETAGENDQAFIDAIKKFGDLTIYLDRTRIKPALMASPEESKAAFTIKRLNASEAWSGDILAMARDGRILARQTVTLDAGKLKETIDLDLPLALQNKVAIIRIDNAESASAVHLVDARNRRALVGILEDTANAGDKLLSGEHYIREALAPHAEIVSGPLEELVAAGAAAIVLNDIGALRASDQIRLTEWIESGGVLIRFAGPILAEAALDGAPALLPAPLRGGGRAFGGALTWDTPQHIDSFPETSPFAGLAAPDDAFVRRQVLAEPGGETTLRSWARLKDGTPLVTGQAFGAGAIALFHITATPEWSDLPLTGLFVAMLRRLVFLSAISPNADEISADRRYPPIAILDGFGRLQQPTQNHSPLTAEDLSKAADRERMPGFYGSPDAALAINAISAQTPYNEITVSGATIRPYEDTPPQTLAPPLFLIAFALLLIDGLAIVWLSGRLRLRRLLPTAGGAALIASAALFSISPQQAIAQPLDRAITQDAKDAALTTRLAYVRTGSPTLDRLSAQALAGLSRELYRRTALEPGTPIGIDPETDDLSVYPFLYWPIAADAPPPTEAGLANIENFMRFGGLILFDTRDDERAIAALSTPEAIALQQILSQLNIPPLTPVTRDHVLTRSFYLLSDGLYGRLRRNPVWVSAETGGANDGVTPIIIGGRDWAGAWAVDQYGRPVRPMVSGGERARELAIRAGVNIVMVAFTGNYKSDQVHTPVLLERLGR